MEGRLTNKKDNRRQSDNSFCDIFMPEIDNKYYKKLAQYENTGLQPSEVVELQHNNKYLLNKKETDSFNYKELHKFKNILQKENEKLKQEIKNLKHDLSLYEDDWDCEIENERLKQQLAEKEELLKNAICPKFKIGDELFYKIYTGTVRAVKSENDKVQYRLKCNDGITRTLNENTLFATKEEAEKALKELEGK